MAVITVHQCLLILTRRKCLPCEGFAPVGIQPTMKSCHVDIGGRGHEKGSCGSRTPTFTFKNALLPVQENLVVFENLVVADVLKPAGAESDQQSR